jgi:hypothetical protein
MGAKSGLAERRHVVDLGRVVGAEKRLYPRALQLLQRSVSIVRATKMKTAKAGGAPRLKR